MARRSARSKKSDGARPDAGRGESRTLEPPVSPRIVGMILGGFALASLIVLAISWPGYRFRLHTARAERALADARHEDAIEHLEFILDRYERAWARRTQLGDCFLELGRAEEALAAYETSLGHEPDQDLSARLGRAYFLLDPGGAKTIEHLQKAYDTDPNDPEANYYIGLYHVARGNDPRAALRFRSATASEKFRERAFAELEKILRRLLEI